MMVIIVRHGPHRLAAWRGGWLHGEGGCGGGACVCVLSPLADAQPRTLSGWEYVLFACRMCVRRRKFAIRKFVSERFERETFVSERFERETVVLFFKRGKF